jgi:hypothetical protein
MQHSKHGNIAVLLSVLLQLITTKSQRTRLHDAITQNIRDAMCRQVADKSLHAQDYFCVMSPIEIPHSFWSSVVVCM